MKIKTLATVLLLGLGMASAAQAMDYQHIRNATGKINYAGTTFLVDPYLADKGTYPGFEGTVNSQLRNPLIDMTMSKEDVLKGVQAVIVTHTHPDHWDEVAQKEMPKDLPIFVQNAGNATIIRNQGFKDVRVMGDATEFNGVKLTRIKSGQHGTNAMYAVPQMAELLDDAMGFIMQGNGEKTAYVVGDTIWNKGVDDTLAQFKPDVIVMNTCFAQTIPFKGQGIIMGTEDVSHMRQAMPKADIVTVHMDAVNP